MASKGGLLSDVQLRQWIKAGKPLSVTDGGGLIFTLSAAGNAAWVLRYRHGTRRPEMTLGPYPAIGLSEARTMALVKRAVEPGMPLLAGPADATVDPDDTIDDAAKETPVSAIDRRAFSQLRRG